MRLVMIQVISYLTGIVDVLEGRDAIPDGRSRDGSLLPSGDAGLRIAGSLAEYLLSSGSSVAWVSKRLWFRSWWLSIVVQVRFRRSTAQKTVARLGNVSTDLQRPNGEDEPLRSAALRDSSRSSIPMQG